MQVCYIVIESCMPPMTSNEVYHDWYQCELAGLGYATELLNEIGPELVNKNKVAINFTCINENQTNKATIQSIK